MSEISYITQNSEILIAALFCVMLCTKGCTEEEKNSDSFYVVLNKMELVVCYLSLINQRNNQVTILIICLFLYITLLNELFA